MKLKTFSILFVLAAGYLTSCNKDETEFDTCDYAFLTCSFSGGQTYSGSGFNNTLLHEEEGGETGRRMDLRCKVNSTETLILSLSNWDFQNPPTNGILTKMYETHTEGQLVTTYCEDRNGYTMCDGAMITLIKNGQNYFSVDELPGSVTISECNSTEKYVSGSYEAKLANFSGDTIKVQGSFLKLCYSALN